MKDATLASCMSMTNSETQFSLMFHLLFVEVMLVCDAAGTSCLKRWLIWFAGPTDVSQQLIHIRKVFTSLFCCAVKCVNKVNVFGSSNEWTLMSVPYKLNFSGRLVMRLWPLCRYRNHSHPWVTMEMMEKREACTSKS